MSMIPPKIVCTLSAVQCTLPSGWSRLPYPCFTESIAYCFAFSFPLGAFEIRLFRNQKPCMKGLALTVPYQAQCDIWGETKSAKYLSRLQSVQNSGWLGPTNAAVFGLMYFLKVAISV